MKIWQKICGIISAAAFLSLLLFTLLGLQGVIEGVILDGVVLAPGTEDIWSQNPGATNTLTLRNFTFYNLTNPREFLYKGAKPRFTEISNYLLQERSNFTNITYSADKSYIDFNYWLYFNNLPYSKDLNQQVTVPNLAPIGFWSQLANIDISVLAIQGFGGLFVAMNNTIRMQAVGQGVAGQYLSNLTSFKSLCKMMQIDSSKCDWLYNDPIYGLGDGNNYEVWVDWSYYNKTDSEMLIYEYFGLKRIQMITFDKVFERWCSSVDSILNNWYCQGTCTNYDLTYLQLSSSGLTANPPSGDASDSICLSPSGQLTQNISCQGFPQLFSFHKYQFPKINNGSEFKGLKFSIQTTKQLFSPNNGTLLNVGNLSRLFQAGNNYDKSKTAQNLQKIVKQTHAQSPNHAIVIWEYAKYFAYEFVLQSKDKGTKQIAGLGGVFSQALYQSFVQFTEWILPELLSLIIAQKIPNCSSFLKSIIEDISDSRANQLCLGINAQNYRNYYRLIEPCNNQYFIDSFQREANLSGYEVGELCNPNQTSLLMKVLEAHQIIHDAYNCSANLGEKRCSKYELGVKQFINSTITQNPLDSTIKQYSASLTGKDWNGELQEWQYRHFLNELYGDSQFDKQQYSNYTRLSDLLSFNKLFNGPMIQNLTLVQNNTFFEQLYYWKNKTLLSEYIRFITIQIGLGGFTQKRTVNELIFGYEDPFLKTLKEMDPMLGGDPSITTLVAINEPNATLAQAANTPQSMFTGYSDAMITRNYRSNLGKQIITCIKVSYDGYEIISELVPPFKEPVRITGTDGLQGKPLSNSNDYQYIFISNLYRVGELKFDKYVDKFGFKAIRYLISDKMLASSEEYPPNDNFYQGIRGFMNLSFLGLPLFASKNHFLGASEEWANLVEVYDESQTYPQFANQWDETEVIMEPNSGATFVATLYLQTNLYLQKDILFTAQARMLPVFTLYRSGNLTEEKANELLGDLKTALAAPKKLLLLSIFGLICTACCLLGCMMKSKRMQRTQMKESLMSSTNSQGKVQQVHMVEQQQEEEEKQQ